MRGTETGGQGRADRRPKLELEGWDAQPRRARRGGLVGLVWGAGLRLVCACGRELLTISNAHPARVEQRAREGAYRVGCPDCGAGWRLGLDPDTGVGVEAI